MFIQAEIMALEIKTHLSGHYVPQTQGKAAKLQRTEE